MHRDRTDRQQALEHKAVKEQAVKAQAVRQQGSCILLCIEGASAANN